MYFADEAFAVFSDLIDFSDFMGDFTGLAVSADVTFSIFFGVPTLVGELFGDWCVLIIKIKNGVAALK